MMNNLVLNFWQNYGALLIAGIKFCIVDALSYLFRRYLKVTRMQKALQMQGFLHSQSGIFGLI